MKFAKLNKNQKQKNYSTLFLDEKCKKTHFGYIEALDLRFYSITLKFEPQLHKEIY
jgi:hypothetical protein